VRRGRKGRRRAQFFPGYVLVKMKLTDEAFHLIKNTRRSRASSARKTKPMPISEAEAMRILHQCAGRRRAPEARFFRNRREVSAWPTGRSRRSPACREIDEARSRVEGRGVDLRRATPVELEFGQVEKV